MKNFTVLIAPFRTATLEEQEQTIYMAASEKAAGRWPIFLPWMMERILSDEEPAERAQALMASRQLCESVSSAGGECLVLEGRVTDGMRSDFLGWAVGDPHRRRMRHWVRVLA